MVPGITMGCKQDARSRTMEEISQFQSMDFIDENRRMKPPMLGISLPLLLLKNISIIVTQDIIPFEINLI